MDKTILDFPDEILDYIFKDEKYNTTDKTKIRQVSKNLNNLYLDQLDEFDVEQIRKNKKKYYKNLFFGLRLKDIIFNFNGDPKSMNIWSSYELKDSFEFKIDFEDNLNDFILYRMKLKIGSTEWSMIVDIIDSRISIKYTKDVPILYKDIKSVIMCKIKEDKICWVRLFMDEFEFDEDGDTREYYSMNKTASDNLSLIQKSNPSIDKSKYFHKIEYGCEFTNTFVEGIDIRLLLQLENVDYSILSKDLNKNTVDRSLFPFWAIPIKIAPSIQYIDTNGVKVKYNIKLVYYFAMDVNENVIKLHQMELHQFMMLVILNKDILTYIRDGKIQSKEDVIMIEKNRMMVDTTYQDKKEMYHTSPKYDAKRFMPNYNDYNDVFLSNEDSTMNDVKELIIKNMSKRPNWYLMSLNSSNISYNTLKKLFGEKVSINIYTQIIQQQPKKIKKEVSIYDKSSYSYEDTFSSLLIKD